MLLCLTARLRLNSSINDTHTRTYTHTHVSIMIHIHVCYVMIWNLWHSYVVKREVQNKTTKQKSYQRQWPITFSFYLNFSVSSSSLSSWWLLLLLFSCFFCFRISCFQYATYMYSTPSYFDYIDMQLINPLLDPFPILIWSA